MFRKGRLGVVQCRGCYVKCLRVVGEMGGGGPTGAPLLL